MIAAALFIMLYFTDKRAKKAKADSVTKVCYFL